MTAEGMTHPGLERHRPISFVETVWEVVAHNPADRGSFLLMLAGQVWWMPPFVVAWVWFGSAISGPAFEGWGMSPSTARWFAGGLLLMSAIALAGVLGFVFSAAYSRMRPPDGLLLVLAVPPTVFVCAVLDAQYGLPLIAALAIALVCSFAVFLRVRASVAKVPTPVHVHVWLDDPSRAADLVAECERQLLDQEQSLSESERTAVEINLASALAVVALDADGGDALPRAYEILARSLDDDAEDDPMGVYVGAARLVEAMAVKASRTGDLDGYEQALQLMTDAGGLLAQIHPGVMARALLIRATHLAALGWRAGVDGHPGRAARLRDEALDDLLAALEHSSRRPSVHLVAQVKFAALTEPSSGDLDAAIELCTRATRRLRLRSRVYHDLGRLVLCDLLAQRAAQDPAHPRAARDVATATRLCRRLRRRPSSRAEAARRLPRLLAAGGADAGDAYRQAFEQLSSRSGSAAADIAAEWSSWARPGTPEAGEAHWCWIRAVADDARRRPIRAEQERRLADSLGLPARAAEQLLATGRPRDAVVALDTGRALLMTERLDQEQDGIAERLSAAGREDLAARWDQTRASLAEADREGFAAGRTGANTMLVAGRRFQQRFTSTAHLALADRERLLREVSRVPGCEDVDAPATYEDLRAAAGEGPIVYLSAHADRGHAIVVSDAAQPLVVPLALTARELDARAQAWRDAIASGDVSAELGDLLVWLQSRIGDPLMAHLEPGALVTLIPLGALSLLPLHALGMAPDDAHGIWRDGSGGRVFRYAPNARVLARAQTHARALPPRTLPVLTVGVRKVAGHATLDSAELESAGVFARVGADRAVRLASPTRAAVLRAMDQCGIWHFACHGLHKPAAPLESSLALEDGELTLRTIYARPAGPRRLAVLSACNTAAPDEALLDEVVSFPGALMRAGVAGVVSSQWEVGDDEAMLLVLRFFDELARDDVPVRALARAQRWLCAATNAEIHEAMGDAYGPTSRDASQRLEVWRARQDFAEPRSWAPFSYWGA